MDSPAAMENIWQEIVSGESPSFKEIDNQAQRLLSQMSLDEKIDQMSGDLNYFPGILELWLFYNRRPYPSGKNTRLHIPPIQFSDGPRGVVLDHATTFPVSAARGATWDIELEERIGEAMGAEARALGANLVAAACINVLRHPAWGRAQETYGEDPYHLGEMGAALLRGLQRHVMGCVKHYACNSIEDTRMKVDVRINERTLREIYLPQFKRCVEENPASLMSAYNQVNGDYCGENHHLLNEILKEEWGFNGFVMSDFVFGLRDARKGLEAGLDMEMPFSQQYGNKLKRLVHQDASLEPLIDAAVLRILRQKIMFSRVGHPEHYHADIVACPEHRALALQAAVESMVLLKNEPPVNQRYFPEQKRDLASMFSFSRNRPEQQFNMRVSDAQRFGVFANLDLSKPILPISPYKINRLAVIGRLAEKQITGDRGSSMTHTKEVLTPLHGIVAAAQDHFEVVYNSGLSPLEAADKARSCDVVIVIVGFTDQDEGENMFTRGGDRQRLELQDSDMALILTTIAANPRTVVVIVGSGVVIMENWIDYVPAVLMSWYSGMEGGLALADIIFGKANPSGKLPVVFPSSEKQLPPFDNHSLSVEYGYYHGYRLMERKGQEPAFPFGFGLSYTSYAYDDLQIVEKEIPLGGEIHASVKVTNTGLRSGEEIVQFYVGCPGLAVERPLKELKGFKRLHLEAGETKTVEIKIQAQDLAYYDEAGVQWVVEPGIYALFAGGSSAEKDLRSQKFKIIT
jgi:beta-glucosidase